MRLYQHSARCPIALRAFLDCNPDYWCFIPMYWQDAVNENVTQFQSRRTTMSMASPTDLELMNIVAMGVMDNGRVANSLQHVPLPPAVYGFSFRQRRQQRAFFERFLSLSTQQLPYASLDLYQVALIAVCTYFIESSFILIDSFLLLFLFLVPDDRSILFRYIIETLFVVHGETKLNMICPIGIDPEKRYGRCYNLVWCANLNRPLSTQQS